jgi:hypothetical protein
MSPPLVIAAAFVVLGFGIVVLCAPKWAAALIWPVLFCYPQNLFYGLLPWNAGLDDIYILLVTARLSVNLLQPSATPWARRVVVLAFLLAVAEAVSNYTGCLRYPFLWMVATRDTLKNGVLVALALGLALDIRQPEDIRRHMKALMAAMSLAFAIVVACYIYPFYLSKYWEYVSPSFETWFRGTARYRAYGGFMGPSGVGRAVVLLTPMVLAFLFLRPRNRALFALSWVALAAMAGAMLAAKSRMAVLGLGGMFGSMLLVSRFRRYVIMLGAVGVIAAIGMIFLFPDVLAALEKRLTPEAVREGLALRGAIWKLVITTPTLAVLFFGEGHAAMMVRLRTLPHSGYLGAVFMRGIGGAIMLTVLFWSVARWSLRVSRYDPDPVARAVGWGGLWGLVGMAFLSLVNDPWIGTSYQPFVYFLAIAVSVRYDLLMRSAATAGAPVGYEGSLGLRTPYPLMPN